MRKYWVIYCLFLQICVYVPGVDLSWNEFRRKWIYKGDDFSRGEFMWLDF